MSAKRTSHVTPYGHHAYLAFRECPRRYYFSYLFNGGMESKVGNTATTAGTCFHTFTQVWHSTGSAKKAMSECLKMFAQETKRWEIFRSPDKQEEVRQELHTMCELYPDFDRSWQARNGKLKFIEAEEYAKVLVISPSCPAGAPFTSRRDAVVLWSDEYYIFETKRSGLQDSRMTDFHRMGGQVSGYIVTTQGEKRPCVGALINHARPLKTPEFFRKAVLREPHILENWKDALGRTYQQMEEAKTTGYPCHYDACVTYTTACSFRDVCLLSTPAQQEECLRVFYRQRT